MTNPASYKTSQAGGRAMTLGQMRELGIRRLWLSCLNRACQHDALLDVSNYPAGVQILALRHQMKCEKCGGRNVDVRPYWKERSPRPRLVIADEVIAKDHED
jgi:hypothetical protein